MLWLGLLAAGVGMSVVTVAWAAVWRPAPGPGLVALTGRCQAVRVSLRDALPPWAAAGSVLLAGLAATVVVCWPLGVIFKALQPAVDVPLFRFAQSRQGHRTWTAVNGVFTQMGNRLEVKIVCVVAAVILVALWRRRSTRSWWIPPAVITAAFAAEKYGQKILGKVVDRGHPPTTLGTYPSGGCARLLAIYGVILYLIVRSGQRERRGARLWLFGGLSVAAFIEGYSRIFLLKHWFTDVVGGWVYGSLLLVVLIAATATLTPAAITTRPGPGRRPADLEPTQT